MHVVVLVREDDYHDRYRKADKLAVTDGREIDWPAPYWYVDAGAAMMLLMLGAIAEGLAAVVFGVTDIPALREALSLPDDLHFVAVVTVGYPAGEDEDRATAVVGVFSERRKPRADVVHWERWGGAPRGALPPAAVVVSRGGRRPARGCGTRPRRATLRR